MAVRLLGAVGGGRNHRGGRVMGRGIEAASELVPVCEEFVRRCKAAGLNDPYHRNAADEAEQDRIYARGRTGQDPSSQRAVPKSPLLGVAFDFCRNVKGPGVRRQRQVFGSAARSGKGWRPHLGRGLAVLRGQAHLEMTKYMPNSSPGRADRAMQPGGVLPDDVKKAEEGRDDQRGILPDVQGRHEIRGGKRAVGGQPVGGRCSPRPRKRASWTAHEPVRRARGRRPPPSPCGRPGSKGSKSTR